MSCDVHVRHQGDLEVASTGEVMMGFRTCFHACMSVSLASSVMKGAEAKGLGVNCPGV